MNSPGAANDSPPSAETRPDNPARKHVLTELEEYKFQTNTVLVFSKLNQELRENGTPAFRLDARETAVMDVLVNQARQPGGRFLTAKEISALVAVSRAYFGPEDVHRAVHTVRKKLLSPVVIETSEIKGLGFRISTPRSNVFLGDSRS